MTPGDLRALLPFIILAATAVVIMLAAAFYRSRRLTALLTLVGLGHALVALPYASSASSRQVTSLLIVDDYALFFTGLILAATFAVAALSYGYLKRREGVHEEFYILLVLAALGSAILAASSHFASFFLGLEVLSVSLYGLIAYPRREQVHIEAGLKYLILAGASAAFLLFGMALVYLELGTMEFARIGSLGALSFNATDPLLLAGFGMLVIGVGFKLAVVPFHMWTPDIYEGAPAPVSAFVATVSKGGTFALLLRFFAPLDGLTYRSLFLGFVLIAIASMLAGNLLALLQHNVKRILAYSSIAHLGYLLVAFIAGGPLAVRAAVFYLVAYFVTMLAAFGVITVLSGAERDLDRIDDYRGLFWRRPRLAGVFTAALLSLAGIPLTAGFVGKFYLVVAGVGAAFWVLVIVLVLASSIGLFYYLRIVVALYQEPPPEVSGAAPSTPLAGGLVLAALAILLVWLGVAPSPLLRVIEIILRV